MINKMDPSVSSCTVQMLENEHNTILERQRRQQIYFHDMQTEIGQVMDGSLSSETGEPSTRVSS